MTDVVMVGASTKKKGKRGRKDEFDVGGRLVFGASGLAGLYQSIGENQAKEVIKTAIELGVRKFDTAPHYGCGLSERRLGEGIRQYIKKGQYLIDELEKRVDFDDIGEYSHPHKGQTTLDYTPCFCLLSSKSLILRD